jgi:hypothetical protein
MAAIAHLIRCLFRRGGKIFNGGLVSSSWVASVFGVGERSVHSARRWLRSLGFLTEERVHQLVMNRFGGKFLISLERPEAKTPRAESAPPSILKRGTLRYFENQINNKPAFAAPGVRADEQGKPTLRNVQFEDLKKLPRLEELYRQTVEAGWLEASEASLRNFLCAALRATQAGGRVGAIFVGIVRKKLWHHVTQAQEDRAMTVLKSYRARKPDAFSASGGAIENPDPRVFELVKTVLNCASAKSAVNRWCGDPESKARQVMNF